MCRSNPNVAKLVNQNQATIVSRQKEENKKNSRKQKIMQPLFSKSPEKKSPRLQWVDLVITWQRALSDPPVVRPESLHGSPIY